MHHNVRRMSTQMVSSLPMPKMERFSRLTAFESPDHSERPQDPGVSVSSTEPNGECDRGVNCHKCRRWMKERISVPSNTVILRSPTKIGRRSALGLGQPDSYPHSLTPYIPPSCPLHHSRTMTPPILALPRRRITPFRTTVSTSYSAIQRNNPSFLSRADLSVPLPTSTCVCSRWPSITSAKTQISK